MKFKVFIINLDTSTERWQQVSTQCDRLGIAYERVSAVRGSELIPEERAKVYDLPTNLKKYDKRLNDGEIGCYLSHVHCWNKIIDQELDFALILEDDVQLEEQIRDCISLFEKMDTCDWDYIKLFSSKRLKLNMETMELGKGMQLHRVSKLSAGTCSQFVSASGARKLLKHAFPIARPVDADIQHWYERDLRCFVVTPSVGAPAGFESEIDMLDGQHRDYVKRRPLKRIILLVIYEFNLLVNSFKLAPFPKVKG
ncbi:glycosyltransferase family 25 protein [uncultured Shewanella sp.]|uniref:glycosyltransferase family 25 protein n=1 Tax=uncultured Shewanella sp. TaxID=173975 RepID=UPI002622ED1C|nr:glycosyltransferase family 25 protein [uncultured Shewanella sp.]